MIVMALIKDKKCIGYLRKESPLRDLFPGGEVPLKSPIVQRGKGREGEPVKLLEVDMAALDDKQILKIIIAMQKILNEEIDQEAFFKEGFRLKAEHFDGFAFDGRLIA